MKFVFFKGFNSLKLIIVFSRNPPEFLANQLWSKKTLCGKWGHLLNIQKKYFKNCSGYFKGPNHFQNMRHCPFRNGICRSFQIFLWVARDFWSFGLLPPESYLTESLAGVQAGNDLWLGWPRNIHALFINHPTFLCQVAWREFFIKDIYFKWFSILLILNIFFRKF